MGANKQKGINMFKCLRKRRRVFTVTIKCCGKHPYITDGSLDLETKDFTLVVRARDWNDAENVAMSTVIQSGFRTWSYRCHCIYAGIHKEI